MSDNQPDYRQAQEQQESQAWQEMMIDLEKYLPFKADFERFIASHEESNNVREV